jgi:trehalose 6-phosphate phosphatase
VLELAAALASEFELEIRPGRRVVELVVPGPGKGDAMVALANERDLSTVFVAGDDVADLEAFEMVRALPVRSVIAAVASTEAPDGLNDGADVVLDGPAELVDLLAGVARALT